MTILKTASVNANHFPASDGIILRGHAWANGSGCPWILAKPNGCLAAVPQGGADREMLEARLAFPKGLSDEFVAALDEAARLGCAWLDIDADAE